MPREHATIKMTDDEIRSFLGSFDVLVLATVDADGAPWVDAVSYRLVDGRVWFRVPRQSRSHANILGDPRSCCVVEHRPPGSYYGIKAVMIHGIAVEETPSSEEAITALESLQDPVTGKAGDFVVMSVPLDDVTSFAFEKIRYRYEQVTDEELAK